MSCSGTASTESITSRNPPYFGPSFELDAIAKTETPLLGERSKNALRQEAFQPLLPPHFVRASHARELVVFA